MEGEQKHTETGSRHNRHFFATTCIESGVDIPTISRWLGHKDGGALAMRTYGHLRDEHSLAMSNAGEFQPSHNCQNRQWRTWQALAGDSPVRPKPSNSLAQAIHNRLVETANVLYVFLHFGKCPRLAVRFARPVR